MTWRETPRPARWPATGRPPSITDRLRSTCPRTQPSTGPAQPPPQIIGRPSDVERLLDEAGQRAQEVERGAAQAVEETAAVAAEESEVAIVVEGVGGAFGYLGGWQRSSSPGAHRGQGCWNVGAAAGNGGAGRGHRRRSSLRPRARHGMGAGETLFRPQQGSEDAAVQDVRSANNMNDATQPQHFTLRPAAARRQPRKQPHLLSVGFRIQAHSNNTPRPFFWQLNLVIEIEFADATTALWSENAGAHPAGATPSTDFEIQNVRVLASGLCAGRVLQPGAPLRKVPGVQLPHGAHAAVQRPKQRGGAQRHRGARLHENSWARL